MQCSSAEWIARNGCALEMMPSWCRQVNWVKCGIPWVNCAFLSVKDDWKGQFWSLRYWLSKLRSLLIFPSGLTSHSKIVQLNWQCIGRLRLTLIRLSPYRAVNTLSRISIVEPTRCTISNLFYFGTTLYMFQTVFPSIIRSLRLYTQHQVCHTGSVVSADFVIP
jgi:hypothetical protein